MTMESVFLPRLAVCQPCKLFGITKDELNLKASLVHMHNGQGVWSEIGRGEHDIHLGGRIDKNHHVVSRFRDALF